MRRYSSVTFSGLTKPWPSVGATMVSAGVPFLRSADTTAAFNQYKAMEAALRKNGTPAETMVAPTEGHGFVKPENIAELYRRMEAFLAKHIGPGTQATTAGTQ